MSNAASYPPMARHPNKPYSLSASHHESFAIPHHSLTNPHSRIDGHITLNGDASTSSPGSRLSLKQASQITAKNVMFYRSGDTNYQSFKVAVTKRNFRTFDSLLENLSEKVPLPFGVRTISTPNGTHGISRLEELEDGKAYICSDRKTVKPLNLSLVQKSRPPWFISKPKTRTRQIASLVRRAEQTSRDSTIPPRYLQVKTPKKVVIVKNGDPTFRHTILLSRRTPQGFEQILDDVAEIFRVKQHKLYASDGRRVESLQELFLGGNVFILGGKEPFIPMEYRARRNANSHAKSESSTDNSTKADSAIMPKELKKTKGRWRVAVTTSELPAAGTDSRVVLTVYGVKGNSGPIPLGHNNSAASKVANKDKTKKLFMSGNEDEFVINVGFIADIKKIRISHDNSGKTSPGWLCEEVVMTDLTTGEVRNFPFNRWLSRDEDDGEICRELPTIVKDEAVLPVLRYIVSVTTGDLWNAGTEANVYITLYGNIGDSGARLLQINGKAKVLHKGMTDVFRFEAVDLGQLQRIVIGHDGIGPGAGWFLEKIVVKEDRVGSEEYVFPCGRWLDEGEDDRKIVRELHIEQKLPPNSRVRGNAEKAKELELWEQEKWKFQKGNRVMIISKSTGRAIRTRPDGSVDGLGEVAHPFGVYEVIRRRGCVRVFVNDATPAFHLAIDQNRLLGQGKGGTFCEFVIKVQPDRSMMFESCRYTGHYISIDPSGKPADTRGNPNTIGRLFIVYVKGCFRNNSVILLNTSATQALVVNAVGDVVGTGKRCDVTGETKANVKSPNFTASPQWAHFRVIKVAEGVRMFQCEKNPRRYLRIKDGQCDGLGSGDVYCHFKVQKYKQGAYVTLQSMKHRGVFIGLSSNGKARPTVDTGDNNTQFFPEVIKFGDRKKTAAQPWKTPEPSFLHAEENEHGKKQDKKSTPLKSTTASSSKSTKHQITTLQNREDSNPGPSEGDYRIYVTTGNAGTKEVVTFIAYGDKGSSGNITLGKGSEGGVFQCGQTDEFQSNLLSVGRLYKIRIGIEEASANCDWRLKQVKMKDMMSNEIFRFKFNRWVSRNKDDGDTLRELPVIVEGAEGDMKMHRYHIQVKTGKGSSAFFTKKSPMVYICLFGERGDTGRRLLQRKSFLKNNTTNDASKKLFVPEQTDVFEIEAVSLGILSKCSLSCPTSLHASSKMLSTSSYPSWLCDEIIVRESEGASTEYVFNCKKWLGLKKAGSHAQLNLSLSEIREVKPVSSDEAEFKEGEWKVCVTTGSQSDAGTSANVVFYACGLDGSNSSNVLLGNGKDGLFTPGKTHKFKVDMSEVKDLYKIRIGHDGSGKDPSWFLESVKLMDLHNDVSHTLSVRKWLAADRENYQLQTEIPIPRPGMEPIPVLNYQVMVYTGGILGSDTDANVHLCLYGTRGNSGTRPLLKSLNNDLKFQESQVDIFELEAVSLGALTKIKIGHDGVGHGNGWFLHKVVIKESDTSSEENVFFCNRWLDDGQDDGKIEREIVVEPHDDTMREKMSDGEYKVFVTTGAQSTTKDCPLDARVTIIIYGEEGKTGEISLQPTSLGRDSKLKRKQSRSKSQSRSQDRASVLDCFKPNNTDEFKIDIPDIGQIYKVRISYNPASQWTSWYLDKVVLQEISSSRRLIFPCHRWLSSTDDDQETVREIAVVREGQETLKTILYNVSIHTGDRHGAGTDAGVYVLLRGDRGDSGRRYLRNSSGDSQPFQRSSVDVFTIEAVDLGRIVEVIVGHDGEGFGAGWFVDKIAVRPGEFASNEWVFPCNAWLDDHVGDNKVSRRLFPVGVIVLDSQEEELEHLATPSSREAGKESTWDLNVLISEVTTEGINRIHLTGIFYGSNGLKKTDIISLGEWSTGGRKQLKLQTDFGDISEIYKLRVEIPDYDEPVSLTLAYVAIQNIHTKEQMQFAFYHQLRTGSGSTIKELPALKLHRPYPKLTRYLVDVLIAAVKENLSPEGKLRLKLTGDAGDSGFRTLLISNRPFHATEHKDGYVFHLDAVDLGRLTTVTLAYESAGKEKSPGWMVDGVSIQIDDPPSSTAVVATDSVAYRAEVQHTFKAMTSIERVEKEYNLFEELPAENQSYSRKSSRYRRSNTQESMPKASEGLWNMTLSYSEGEKMQGDETDDILMIQDLEKEKVQVQVFGTRNSSDTLLLSSLNPKRRNNPSQNSSQMKVIETCLSLGADMGTIYLMRLTSHEWNSNLVKIKLKDVHTKQEFLYHITESQHKKILNSSNGIKPHLDIPLVRPDIPPLEHHKYKVMIHTGDFPAAGTDANIWVNLFGTHGDTGLRKVNVQAWNTFRRDTTETFAIETVDVGEPRRISVNHDGVGYGGGWYLEDIVVHEERNEKATDFVFQCNRWLDDGVDEKVTQKDLYLTGIKFNYPTNYLKPTNGCWQCRLKTKMLNDDGSEMPLKAKVSFFLKHKAEPVIKVCNFEGTEKEFDVTFPEDEGEGGSTLSPVGGERDDGFYKIRAEVVYDDDRRTINDWPFEELLMADLDSREKLHFVFDDAPVWNGSNRDVVRELPVMRARQKSIKLFDYYIMFFTANDSVPHSNHNMKVEVLLAGENGDTGWRQLRETPKNDSSAILQPGKMEMLFTEAVDLGKTVQSVSVKVAETTVRWKLDKIKVKKGFFSKEEFVFECGRWIEVDPSSDKEVVKLELSSTVLSPYPPTSRMIASDDDGIETYDVHTLWDVVSNSSENGGLSKQKFLPSLAMKLYGSEDASGLEFIDKMSISKGRSRANLQITPPKPLHTLCKVGIGIEGFNNNRQKLSSTIEKITLLKLTIRNSQSKEYFSFSPGIPIFHNPTSGEKPTKESGTNWLELVPERPKQDDSKAPLIVDYTITIQTGSQDEAGTEANVYVILHGTHNGHPIDGGKRWLLSRTENKFSRGMESSFVVKGVNLGELKQVTVGHDGNDATMGWFLENISVKPSNSSKTYIFVCKKWLANLEDDTFVERTLDVHQVISPETTPKRPISVQGIQSDADDSVNTSSRVATTETLHGKTNEENSGQSS